MGTVRHLRQSPSTDDFTDRRLDRRTDGHLIRSYLFAVKIDPKLHKFFLNFSHDATG
jgi:hypothetical protein